MDFIEKWNITPNDPKNDSGTHPFDKDGKVHSSQVGLVRSKLSDQIGLMPRLADLSLLWMAKALIIIGFVSMGLLSEI